MTAQLTCARIIQHRPDAEDWKPLIRDLIGELQIVAAQVPDAIVAPPRASATRLSEWVEGIALALEHLEEIVGEVEARAEEQHAEVCKLDDKIEAAESEVEGLKDLIDEKVSNVIERLEEALEVARGISRSEKSKEEAA